MNLVIITSACVSGTAVATYAVAEVASITNTKKTLEDNVFSFVTDMDCSTIDKLNYNSKYCKKLPEPKIKPLKTSYCYGTLDNVNCYNEPSINPNDVLIGTYTY